MDVHDFFFFEPVELSTIPGHFRCYEVMLEVVNFTGCCLKRRALCIGSLRGSSKQTICLQHLMAQIIDSEHGACIV